MIFTVFPSVFEPTIATFLEEENCHIISVLMGKGDSALSKFTVIVQKCPGSHAWLRITMQTDFVKGGLFER